MLWRINILKSLLDVDKKFIIITEWLLVRNILRERDYHISHIIAMTIVKPLVEKITKIVISYESKELILNKEIINV